MMEFLADRILVTFRDGDQTRPGAGSRVTCSIDFYGHVDVLSRYSHVHKPVDTTDALSTKEWLIEHEICESRQVDEGPSYELFLTEAWREEYLADRLQPLARGDRGWRRL